MFDLTAKFRRVWMSDSSRRPSGRKLDRRNAHKNIDYDSASWSLSHSSSSSSSAAADSAELRATRSLELSPSYANQKSFRISGGFDDGDFAVLFRNLGLSGPEDFAIPAADWAAQKARCSSDLLPPSRLLNDDSTPSTPKSDQNPVLPDESRAEITDEGNLRSPASSGGIRGARPPALAPPSPPALAPPSPPAPSLPPPPSRLGPLAPPPSMSLPVFDKVGSNWDLMRSLAPEGEVGEPARRSFDSDEDGDEDDEDEEVTREEAREGETDRDLTGSCSYSTSNDDDSSSTSTEVLFVISPNGKLRRNIKSWMRGRLLGSGSFGTVYEAISNEGFFFAVKEVSLIDQGSNAQQCIFQLEQEIALLSQFEHENIVQYYGTDKEEAKLFIFLELASQGSLASLYQKYKLIDSQVSAYTRQILSGLNYLHDRSVVHRDIKCANILVHANGSIKLADFGLAKEITKINYLKSCKGSVYWMAPEVIKPKKSHGYGPPADIWSLGCTVLEMLTHQVPYPNLEWTTAMFRIGRGEKPPIPNSLSRDARDFISQCVQVNPDERPTASQLLDHAFVKRPLPASELSDSFPQHSQ